MKKYGVFIIFVLNFLSGVSSECSNNGKPSPQWFMQFGARGSRNVAVIPNSEIDQKYNSLECSSEESTNERINRDMVKKSGLPLVLIGHQYYYIGKYFKTNFYKAMHFCEEHSMQLLGIETKSENEYILDYLKENLKEMDHFWTSGTDLAEEGHFVWMSTGRSFNYTFWSTPQPDNAGNNENCMEIWKLESKNYVWNDNVCSNNFNFICELKECSSFCLT